MTSKRIYLDTNDWIYLSQIHYGIKTDDPELVEVYNKIKKLSESGEAVFPISFSHLEDIMIRGDHDSRNRLIDFIMSISQGYVLKPYTFHIGDEVGNAVLHRMNMPSYYDVRSKIVAKGLPYIVSTDYDITWNESVKGLPDDFKQKMKKEIEKPESMALILKNIDFSDNFKNDRYVVNDAAKLMEKNRLAKMKLDKETRYNEAAAYFIDYIVNPHLAKLLVGVSDENKKKIIPRDKPSVEKFLEDMPSANVSFRLTYGRDEWYGREVQPNDIADINHLAGAIPYCDIVVTERAFGSLCKQQKLDKKYGCIVLNSLKDLNKIL